MSAHPRLRWWRHRLPRPRRLRFAVRRTRRAALHPRLARRAKVNETLPDEDRRPWHAEQGLDARARGAAAALTGLEKPLQASQLAMHVRARIWPPAAGQSGVTLVTHGGAARGAAAGSARARGRQGPGARPVRRMRRLAHGRAAERLLEIDLNDRPHGSPRGLRQAHAARVLPRVRASLLKRSASSFNPSKVVLLRPSLGFGPGSPSKQKCPEKVEKKSDRSEMQQILFRTPIQKRKESVVFTSGLRVRSIVLGRNIFYHTRPSFRDRGCAAVKFNLIWPRSGTETQSRLKKTKKNKGTPPMLQVMGQTRETWCGYGGGRAARVSPGCDTLRSLRPHVPACRLD